MKQTNPSLAWVTWLYDGEGGGGEGKGAQTARRSGQPGEADRQGKGTERAILGLERTLI